MTHYDERTSTELIEHCRQLLRAQAERCCLLGMSLEDVTIACSYTAMDLATTFEGSPFGGMEWLRTAIDVQERSLLGNGKETRQ